MSALILIMGDQLSFDIVALKAGSKETDVVLLAELRDEASYVQHHKKKIAFLASWSPLGGPCGDLVRCREAKLEADECRRTQTHCTRGSWISPAAL